MLTCLRQLIVWIIAVALLGQALGFSQPAQAIPLQIESLASADVTLLDSNNYKTLGKDHEDASLATEAINKHSSVKEIVFSDTDQFYKELTVAVKSGEAVNIITEYTSYSDFPPRLKKIFKIDADSIDLTKSERHLLSPLGSTPFAAAPILLPLEGVIAGLASIPAKLDYKWLIIPTCTAFGAGVGGAMGLPAGGIGSVPGALVGGAVGLTACSVTVAVMDNKHIVKIEIDPIRGTLAIVIMSGS